jgi:hypothetical protein
MTTMAETVTEPTGEPQPRALFALFEGLDADAFAYVEALIEAVGLHTGNGHYLSISLDDGADVALLHGLAFATSHWGVDASEPVEAVQERVWSLARGWYRELSETGLHEDANEITFEEAPSREKVADLKRAGWHWQDALEPGNYTMVREGGVPAG